MSANTCDTTRSAPTTSSKDLRMHATAIARPRIARARRLVCALTALAAIGIGALGASATTALAGDCPNEQLRSENNSTRLPECRAYEMVTPLYKEGFPVEPQTFSDAGAIAYQSFGSFAGNPQGSLGKEYVARRSSAGWTTSSPDPPPATYETEILNTVEALSPDLRTSLWIDRRGEPPADDGLFYYLRGPDGSMTRVGRGAVPGVTEEPPFTWATSTDLTHILFAHGATGSSSPREAALYEYVGTGNEGLPLSVSIDNTGASTPGEACPAGMSADGRVIAFFSGCNGGLLQLWARVGGSATVAVSHSECTRTSSDPGGACNALAPAEFAGMPTDGSRVYFTSAQQLVNGDTDQTNDLYECEIPPGAPAPVGAANPCASLTEVTHDTSGADVQSVVNVSEDGSRVYFIAKGALAANLGSNDAAPVAGDENLYVWQKDAAHPAGQMTFIAKLEANNVGEAQSTTDGRYLIFTTPSRLLASDTDEASDVYRYDADTHGLLRLSTDSSGRGGNEPGFEARLPTSKLRRFPAQLARPTAMTSDASTVIFETAEALSPADSDGTTDVYEWHEGQVSLISNGGVFGATGFGAIGITRSGQDIYFSTGQPLTAGDSGSEADVYDARVEGGFPATTPQPCSGEACQGSPPPQPQPPGTSASAAFNGPGSPLTAEAPPVSQPKPKPQTAAQKLAKALKACKSRHSKKKRSACEKKARNTYRRGK
jgi:hypothetical protein